MMALVMAAVLAMPIPADLERRVAAACVRVSDTLTQSAGGGVAVGQREGFLYILTAAHIITPTARLAVFYPDAAGQMIPTREVELLAHAPLPDVALLRIKAPDAAVAPLQLAGPAGPPTDDEEEGFDAVSAGWDSPRFVCRLEKVRGKRLLRRADGRAAFAWETMERPERGRSGGPLVDLHGKVIGICSGTQDGKGYYCHQDEIAAVLRKRDHVWLYQGVGDK